MSTTEEDPENGIAMSILNGRKHGQSKRRFFDDIDDNDPVRPSSYVSKGTSKVVDADADQGIFVIGSMVRGDNQLAMQLLTRKCGDIISVIIKSYHVSDTISHYYLEDTHGNVFSLNTTQVSKDGIQWAFKPLRKTRYGIHKCQRALLQKIMFRTEHKSMHFFFYDGVYILIPIESDKLLDTSYLRHATEKCVNELQISVDQTHTTYLEHQRQVDKLTLRDRESRSAVLNSSFPLPDEIGKEFDALIVDEAIILLFEDEDDEERKMLTPEDFKTRLIQLYNQAYKAVKSKTSEFLEKVHNTTEKWEDLQPVIKRSTISALQDSYVQWKHTLFQDHQSSVFRTEDAPDLEQRFLMNFAACVLTDPDIFLQSPKDIPELSQIQRTQFIDESPSRKNPTGKAVLTSPALVNQNGAVIVPEKYMFYPDA